MAGGSSCCPLVLSDGFTCVAYDVIHMAKATKTIRLPIEVAERLEEENNQSVAVEKALREKYDL